MSERDRIKWRCRRGLLELDLVLSRFLDARFERLSDTQQDALVRLLDLPDNDLWDIVIGRADTTDAGCAEIVQYLRQPGTAA